jgi:hypothetical protein
LEENGSGYAEEVAIIVLFAALFYALSDSWSYHKRLVTQSYLLFKKKMYTTFLLKILEESLGPAFQQNTGYQYQGEARGAV